MNVSIFFVLVCLLFLSFNKYGFRLFSKMTWQCWAFAHKHCTFNGFGVLFKNLPIRVGRLFGKQFIVRNLKVTICVAPSRLMGRLGEVVTHERSTVYLNPRYSGKRNWRHRNGNQWYIRPSLKSKHTEALLSSNMTFLVNEAGLKRIYCGVVG